MRICANELESLLCICPNKKGVAQVQGREAVECGEGRFYHKDVIKVVLPLRKQLIGFLTSAG